MGNDGIDGGGGEAVREFDKRLQLIMKRSFTLSNMKMVDVVDIVDSVDDATSLDRCKPIYENRLR